MRTDSSDIKEATILPAPRRVLLHDQEADAAASYAFDKERFLSDVRSKLRERNSGRKWPPHEMLPRSAINEALGEEAFKMRKYDLAIEFYTNALVDDPKNYYATANRSTAYESKLKAAGEEEKPPLEDLPDGWKLFYDDKGVRRLFGNTITHEMLESVVERLAREMDPNLMVEVVKSIAAAELKEEEEGPFE